MSATNGAPVNPGQWDSPPKWVNPCGLTAVDFNSDPEVEQLKDVELVSQIIVQARTALSHTSLFRDNFVRDCFKSDFGIVHSHWKTTQYEWLPSLPKQLGERLDKKYLDGKTLDQSLLRVYRILQTYAVAFEQIVRDQEMMKLPHYQFFLQVELKLRAVLCEVQAALVERAVPLGEDVTRDVMGEEFRTMNSATFRNLRDFLVLRDYINCLEFVIDVFEFHRDESEKL